ncbi:MAG: exodeoxyribonuclease III [Actinomycetota bacterium]|nr:exodeoxyribonuclease III [Actinomycetota bacterium]
MKTTTIYSWNVNGIRAAQRKGFLDWLKESKPGILCVQETKAREEQLSPELTEVPGYRAYFISAERKGYSGVALYTRTEPSSLRGGFGIPRFDGEGRTMVADYGDFVLLNIYFPNGKRSRERLRYKMEFYGAFLDCADALRKKGRELVICGDFNTAHTEIDLARPKENSKVSGFLPEERAWMDEFISHGYLDTFRMFKHDAGNYTWWDLKTGARERNVGWRIDYFFASEGLRKRVRSSCILADVMGSDHCPIGIDLDLSL